MDEKTKQRRREAIGKIIPIVATLPQYEWSRIVSLVDHFYMSKAAKVQLDGNDIELLEKNIKFEMLGESFSR